MSDSIAQRAAILKKLPLLAGAREADLAEIASKVEEKRFAPGDELVQEGGAGSAVFFVVSGKCQVSRKGAGGPEVLATLGAGDFFGEMAVLSPDPRAATVRALEAGSAYILSAWAFREALDAHPGMAMVIMKVLATRLRKVEDELAAAREPPRKKKLRR